LVDGSVGACRLEWSRQPVGSRFNANPESNPVEIHVAGLARLSLLIQRIMDADTIRDTEGAVLLAETEAARRCLEEGDAETARRHVEQVARVTEALLRAGGLDLADGRAVIETARRLLAGETG
jgi:hypothetical protein